MKKKKKDAEEKKEDDEEIKEEDSETKEETEEKTGDVEESKEETGEERKDSFGRTLYSVKCSDCGKETEVPFKPSGDRPVYCRECFQKHRPTRRNF